MKILHTVEFYDPSIGGMQEVVKQISEYLVQRGHEVTVATSQDPSRKSLSINGVNIREFAISGNAVRGMKGDLQAYRNFLLHSDFDIIVNFGAQHWATDLMLPLLREIVGKMVFVPTGFSFLHEPAYAQYFEKMKKWMKSYDMNIFLSESYQDYEFARNAAVKKCIVIPNGASAEEFLSLDTIDVRKDLKIPEDHFLILHVGSHSLIKGHADAIRIFCRANLENATFIIVGNMFSRVCYVSCKISEMIFRLNPLNRVRNRQLLVCSLSRKQTVSLYKSADLFLFPSHVECSPLVLFECMASKTPFLTTDVGNAKEIIEWSQGGVLIPTVKDKHGHSHAELGKAAKLMEELYRNPEKRDTLRNAGFKNWQEKFSWEKIARRYEELYGKLLAEKEDPPIASSQDC